MDKSGVSPCVPVLRAGLSTTANALLQLDLSVFSLLTEVKLPVIELRNIALFYNDINDLV